MGDREEAGLPKPTKLTGKKVAVLGGGPAGLSVAYQLALKGHAVTIFDEREELGGMMRYGIPGFRTPRAVLDAEIQRILDLGVVTRMKCRIGTDITLEQIRPTSTPSSSAWARRAAARCRWKAARRPTSSPPPPS
jgi:NADPH-dependent glutamate synthase beta subunit-like oxidoreductase